MNAPITTRQDAFIREFMLDRKPKAAAVRAGYAENSAAVTAAKLLNRPEIKAEIERRTALLEKRAEIKSDEIVSTLAAIARADMGEILDWGMEKRRLFEDDEESPEIEVPFVRVKPADQIPAHMRAAIAEVSLTDKGTFKIKLHDKGAAIDKLMRHLGMFEADNKQKTDPLMELIKAAQGTALPIATRAASAQQSAEGGQDE